MKKMFWNKVDEKLEKLGKKLEAKKLENINKLKEYRKYKQKITDRAKIERKDLMIEREIKLANIRE